jgi:FMN reductase
MRTLALDGSPRGGGRTAAALAAVLDGARTAGGDVASGVVTLARSDPGEVAERVEEAAVLAIGTPVYRASYATPLKAFLDQLPRGMWGEESTPLAGSAVAIVATGASDHHFLALDDLRNVLAGFFAAHVVPPGLYVPREGFGEDGRLNQAHAGLASEQGEAAVALARAVQGSEALARLQPQV